jgi:hypothetical protein
MTVLAEIDHIRVDTCELLARPEFSVLCSYFVMFQFTGKRRFLLCMWNRWVAEKG